ncbi:histidine kinase dimerization/phospho-acceptor domain-containing protein [Novosphingobium sp. ZN18A2]|uniref:histidine kinase dimerization/phospho-acceptor domain-containing protein n=1 Tax=Novosphingobium sp. ZN18A2 TaxID=3079861 RepID=UPI0030D018AB
MIIDDRLDTVLRTNATGPAAARTQFRQLVDILGRARDADDTPVRRAAIDRLESLHRHVGETERAAIVEAAAVRSPAIVEYFAGQSSRLASSVLRGARLREDDWLDMIPRLPVAARGFLRHRRDLGPQVERLLARFGIGDAVLPQPEGFVATAETSAPASPTVQASPPAPETSAPPPASAEPERPVRPPVQPRAPAPDPREGIGAIVRRIEAFRRNREDASQDGDAIEIEPGEAPRLPFPGEASRARATSVDISLDTEGTIAAATGGMGPMLVGHRPFTADPDAPARCDTRSLAAVRERRPIEAGRIELEGAPAIAGPWRIDAVPCFSAKGGRFTGWLARLRRPEPSAARDTVLAANDDDRDSGDRLRQMLHELRTPINAIQGFAELIHQQVMGPVSHQYRSYAAHIAGDAAKMLAGFEEVDRLVKLETGRMACETGDTDAADVVHRVIAQVEPLFERRGVRLTQSIASGNLPVSLADHELEELVWRLLSVIAGGAAPGERLDLELVVEGGSLRLAATLPASLASRETARLFSPGTRGPDGLPASLLGAGFSLRLAAAEARAANGDVERSGNLITLRLPLLTLNGAAPSDTRGDGGHPDTQGHRSA